MRFGASFDYRRCFRERVAGEHGVALRRVHQAVHQAQPGHGVLGVAHGLAVGGRDAGARESLGERGAADQHRRRDSCGFEVRRGDDHLLRALDQQAGQADGVGVVFPARLDQVFRRYLDAEIDDLYPLFGENDLHEVLADVVHVALDGGEDDLAARGGSRLSSP